MDIVSIIIPVYNSKKYIGRCLDSILNQSYKNIEILAINDGSTDNSLEILNNYAKKYSNIKVIDKKNEGVAKTRNLGISKAKGKYIMFIDNDDYIENDYVETYYKLAEEKKADVVMGGYKRPNINGKIIKCVKLKNGLLNKEMIYKICSPWAKIYKRSYILKNSIKFLSSNLGEDNYFNLQALLMSKKVFTTNYTGYNWYYNDKSVSNTTQKSFEKSDIIKLLNSSYDILLEKGLMNKYYDYIEFYFYVYILWFLCFSEKKYSYKVISKNYDMLFTWLKSKFPNYKKNSYIGFKPKDEVFLYKFFFKLFEIFDSIKLGKILIYLYTRF